MIYQYYTISSLSSSAKLWSAEVTATKKQAQMILCTPRPLKSYSSPDDNTPGATSPLAAMRQLPSHLSPLPSFTTSQNANPLLESQPCLDQYFSTSPHFPLCPLEQDDSMSLTSSPTTSWSMGTPSCLPKVIDFPGL